MTKKYDTAATPFHRVIDHPTTTVDDIAALPLAHGRINPAAVQRQVQSLTDQLLTLATSKAGRQLSQQTRTLK